MGVLRLYPGLKLSLEHNSVRKNPIISACFCCDSRLFLREMDQNFKLGGIIGYEISYLEFSFRHFEVIILHTILVDAAEAVRAHSGKRPGYCYLIGGGPKSIFLGHVTGLLFCLHVKLFLPSLFNSVDFWSSVCCINKLLRGWQFLLMVKFRALILSSKKEQTHKTSVLVHKKFARNCGEQ